MKKIISVVISLMMIYMALPALAQGTVPDPAPATPQADSATDKPATDPAAPPAAPASAETSPPNVNPQMPVVSVNSYVVMDAKTGQVLISKLPDQKESPSNIIKIMTTALALEQLDPASSYTVTKDDVFPAVYQKFYGNNSATSIPIDTDEKVLVSDLLSGTMIRSADDAANALAGATAAAAGRGVALDNGTTSFTSGFVTMMNEKATELGAGNTNFSNPHGLYNENLFTTAYDMALITRYALTVPGFIQYFSATEYIMKPTNKQTEQRNFSRKGESMMEPSNKEAYYDGILGVKTGYTPQSNYTAVAVVERGGTTLICSALNCASSSTAAIQADMKNLLDYCYNNFKKVTFSKQDMNLIGRTTAVYDKRGDGKEDRGAIVGKATVDIDSDFDLLLHSNYSKADIEISSDMPGRYYLNEEMPSTLTFSLKKSIQQSGDSFMVPVLSALKLKVSVVTKDDIANQKKLQRDAIFTKILTIIKYIGIGALVTIVLLFTLRIINKSRHKKRVQARRKAKARRHKASGNPRR